MSLRPGGPGSGASARAGPASEGARCTQGGCVPEWRRFGAAAGGSSVVSSVAGFLSFACSVTVVLRRGRYLAVSSFALLLQRVPWV